MGCCVSCSVLALAAAWAICLLAVWLMLMMMVHCLIAPTPDAMRKMLNICDKFAAEFSILFNAKKSKCLVFQPKRRGIPVPSSPAFYIGGNAILRSWTNGHILVTLLLANATIRRTYRTGVIL
jgi:hypothetical protein